MNQNGSKDTSSKDTKIQNYNLTSENNNNKNIRQKEQVKENIINQQKQIENINNKFQFGEFEEMIIDSKNWTKNKSGDNFKSAFKLVYDIIYKLNSKILALSTDKDKITKSEINQLLSSKCESTHLNS